MPPAAAQRALREASLELARLRRIRGASHRTWRRIARARRKLALAATLLAAAAPAAEAVAAGDPFFRHGLVLDATAIPPSDPVRFPALADIDGDGDLDAFVSTGFGDFFHFEQTGTATSPAFAAGETNPFGLSYVSGSTTLAFADIDGDGDLDAFVASYSGSLAFFANTGTASAPAFTAPSMNPFGLTAPIVHAALADLDGDGDVDLLADAGGTLRFFRNTGTATAPAFAAAVTNPFGLVPASYGSPAFADADGDGDLDVFVGTDFFENTGTAAAPAFAAPETSAFGLAHDAYTPSAAFGDVDGDGDLDAFVGGYYSRAVLYENTGTVNAPAFVASGNPFGLDTLVTFLNETNFRLVSPSPAFGDLDGDGDLDAVVGRQFAYGGNVLHFENTGTALAAAFAAPTALPDPGNARVTLGDLDADGDLDLLAGRSDGNLVLFPNTGSASAPAFAAPVTNPFGLADVGASAAPELADLDDDGDLDVLVSNGATSTLFFANSGTASAPAFAPPIANPFGLGAGTATRPRLADVDGDGDLDLFAENIGGGGSFSGTNFFRNTGTASAPAFAGPSVDPFGLVDVGALVHHAFADVDGDGDLDGFIGNYNGQIVFFENLAIDTNACADGLDNDGDGRVDFGSDPGCASAADTSELGAKQCDNGVDDDGDGLVDLTDPHCMGPLDDLEAPTQPGPGCGLGPELALLVPLLAAVRRRRDSYTARTCPSASPTRRPTSSSSGAR